MKKYFLFAFKLVTSIIAIIVLSLSSLYIYQEITRCPGETILIPKNFIGFVYIVYDEENGLYKKEKGKMLYEVPQNGVYLTRSAYNKRLYTFEHTIEFYYSDSLDIRKLIPNYLHGRDIPKLDSTTIVAIVKSTSSFINTTSFDMAYEDDFKPGPYFIYQIDSLKNLKKEAPLLSKAMYENFRTNN